MLIHDGVSSRFSFYINKREVYQAMGTFQLNAVVANRSPCKQPSTLTMESIQAEQNAPVILFGDFSMVELFVDR